MNFVLHFEKLGELCPSIVILFFMCNNNFKCKELFQNNFDVLDIINYFQIKKKRKDRNKPQKNLFAFL